MRAIAVCALIAIVALLMIRCEFIILLVVFLSATGLGLYGIWACKRWFFVISCLVIGVGILFSDLNALITVAGIAVFFVSYAEFGHGTIRFSELERIALEDKSGGTMIMDLKDAAKRYVYLCSLVILLTFVLTLLLLNLTTILGIFSDKIAESVELNSVYGIVIWMAMVFGIFWLAKSIASKG